MKSRDFLFAGTEDECKLIKRIIDFDGDEIEESYNKLFPVYQNCVYNILLKLAGEGETEHFGCNLKQMMDSLKDYEVDQPIIINAIEKKYNVDCFNEFLASLSLDFLRELFQKTGDNLPQGVKNKIKGKDLKEFSQELSKNSILSYLKFIPVNQLKDSVEIVLDDRKTKMKNLDNLLLPIPEEKEFKEIDDAIRGKEGTKDFDKIEKDKETITYFELFCDFFLINLNILKYGHGKCISVDEKWRDECYKDEGFNKFLVSYPKGSLSVYECFEKYEGYLKKCGRLGKDKSIFKEEYVVFKKIGVFYNLKRNKKNSKKKINIYEAIITLINELLILQRFGPRGVNRPDEWIMPDYVEE